MPRRWQRNFRARRGRSRRATAIGKTRASRRTFSGCRLLSSVADSVQLSCDVTAALKLLFADGPRPAVFPPLAMDFRSRSRGGCRAAGPAMAAFAAAAMERRKAGIRDDLALGG